MRARRSDWDSEIFGLDVGILPEWRPEWTAAGVREANEDRDVVFVKASGWVDPPEGAVAHDHLLDFETAAEARSPNGLARLDGPPPGRLLDLAGAAFGDSRLLRDPRLAPRAADFYRRWLLDARDRILVVRGEEEKAFLIEGRDSDGAGRVELVAVDGARRGRGLGTRIVHGAVTRHDGPAVWRVKASARNWRALRFYERLGFMVRAVSTAFHVWVTA